jgi:hypothetical protein
MAIVKGEIEVKGVQFGFVRRRYPKTWFTWLHYKNEDDKWTAYHGDPWPSRVIPHTDLERIADEIKKSVAPEIEMYEVCEMFDVEILRDYWGGTDEFPEAGHTVFYLGQRPEFSAGLRGFRMTPWFDTMPALYAFCQRNVGKFRDVYRANPDGPAPDATNWL